MYDESSHETIPLLQRLPEDILRIILETAVDPGAEHSILLSEKEHLRLAYKLCLISKSASRWIEPLLYRAVSLETDKQVSSFIYAVNSKSAKFLSQHVRALWILNNGVELYRINFGQLFSTLRNLEKLTLSWYWFMVLTTITSPSSIRHLTLVRPQGSFERLHLRHLPLRSLHIIDPTTTFISKWENASLGRIENPSDVQMAIDDMHARLETIPRICLEFTDIPPFRAVDFLQKLAFVLKNQERKRRDQASSSPSSELDITFPIITRSFWFKGISNDMCSLARTTYTSCGPPNRPIGIESPMTAEQEFRRYCRMSWLQRIKEAIRYNELRWDIVEKSCGSKPEATTPRLNI